MYKKIWGLGQLERMQFPIPPYTVIDIAGDAPLDVNEYVLNKIREIGIPLLKDDRMGVTIRVSLPGALDKLGKHGGLHIMDEKEVLRRVLGKHQQYGTRSKIVVQHTIDARCSGTVLKENDFSIVEAILGDAPPLLEGETVNYEKWIFHLKTWRWEKEKKHMWENKEATVLTPKNLELFEKYIRNLPTNAYLEWSISKSGKLYFYEYHTLKAIG